MKFSDGDWIIDEKTGEVSQIVGVDTESKEYAFINCLGRRIWLDSKYIDNKHKPTSARYTTSAFDF